MLTLPVPQQDMGEMYTACVNRTQDLVLREGLHAEADRVLLRAAEYRAAGQHMAFHAIEEDATVNVSAEQLAGLYSRVLVQGGERAAYITIRNASLRQRCPLCVQRDVQTLDHYLPQMSFPEFAILPENLIPSCFECNHAKSSYIALTSNQQLFHPYYDNWTALPLMYASVEVDGGVEIGFHVNYDGLDEETGTRLGVHFHRLELGFLYSEHAAIELIQKRASFEALFKAAGPEALRDDLLLEATSRANPFPNAWQPVLYRALAASEAFYQGGFMQIDG